MLTMFSTSLPIPRNLSFSSTNSRLLFFNLSSDLPFRVNLLIPNKFWTKSHLLHGRNRFPQTYPLWVSSSDNGELSSDNQSSNFEEEAREAVSEILQEFGVSNEESIEIALNSPRYVKMLIDSVRELDELSLWGSWKSQSLELEGPLSFKRKVYYMAKEKGDNGKVALLESVGLSLFSAMNVARYLARETLPSLIRKQGRP